MSNIRVRSRLSITDLNDQISGATAPSNPEEKSLWLDTSVSPPILKYWDGSTWIPQRLDISELDPDLSITIETIEATMGNMANDNILDIKERGIVVDNINEIIGYLISNKTNAPATLPTIATLDASKKGNFYQTRATARNAGISTSANSYVAVGTAYNALASYLGNMTPIKPWDITDLNKDKKVTVVKDTFRQTWLNYYLAVQKLVEDTALQVKSQIDDHEDRITTVSAGFETLKDSIKLYATKDEVKNSLTAYPTKTEMDAQLNVKADEINLGIKKVEESVTKVSDNFNNLQIGNRNYFSTKVWKAKPALTINGIPYMDIKLEPNTQYTLSTNIPSRDTLRDVFFLKGTDTPSSSVNGVAKDLPMTLTTNADGIVKVAVRDYDLSNGYWIMLSKGNKALDWVPALEDAQLYTAWSNDPNGKDMVRVYPNENLLDNPYAIKGISWDTTASDAPADNYQIGNNSGYSYLLRMGMGSLNQILKADDVITISFDVKMTVGTRLQVYDSNNNQTYTIGTKNFTNIGTEKTRLSFSSKVVANGKGGKLWTLEFYNGNNGDKFSIENVKIEYGETATAYTPSPKIDPVKAEMAYIGYSAKDSNDPADYVWSENPKAKGTFKRWANSADGTVDMTGTYPNENTFSSTTTITTLSGGVIGIRDEVNAPRGFRFTGVKGNAGSFRVNNVITENGEWTVSFKVRGSQSASVYFSLDICDSPAQTFYTTADNTWKEISMTVNVANWTEDAINFVDFSTIDWAHFFVSDFKVSKGKKNIYTTNPMDDPLNAVPQYVGIGSKDTMNPADFVWSENPRVAELSADIANNSIVEMSKDTVLSAVEKSTIAKEWATIQSDYPLTKAQGEKYGVAVTSLNSTYSALSTYITPLLSSMTTNSTIVPVTFQNTFKNYYNAKLAVINGVNDIINKSVDTAKTDAITTSKSYTDSQIKLTSEEIKLGVSKVEESVTKVETEVKNITVGGRNLLQNSTSEYRDISIGAWNVGISASKTLEELGLMTGDEVTLRAYVKLPSTALAGVKARISMYRADGTYTSPQADSYIGLGKEGFTTLTATIPSDCVKITPMLQREYADGSGASYKIQIKLDKLEKGNKPTDWTPAPEDINSSIDSAKTSAISTAKSYTDAQIKVNADAIKLGITETKTYTDSKVNGLEIGGRNLLINTESPTTDKLPSVLGITASYRQSPSILNGATRISKVDNSTEEVYYRFMNTAESNLAKTPLVTGNSYVLSLDVRAKLTGSDKLKFRAQYKLATGNWISIPDWDGTTSISGINETTFTRISGVFTIPTGATSFYFSLQMYNSSGSYPTNGNWFEFKNAQLENGNKPTAWKPAPEDAQLYTAWSNDPNGKDMVRVYPNENLVGLFEKGTINTATGINANATGNIRSIDFVEVKASNIYSFSELGIRRAVNVFYYDTNKVFINRVTVPNSSVVNIPQDGYVRFTYGNTDDVVRYIQKFEVGDMVSLWTPSPKIDPVKAEMAYIGYSPKDSNDPKDYVWSENPKAKGTFKRWSNDPNGLVDMTDVYPNENLLLGTSNEVQSASGTGWFDGTRATNATQTPPELEFSTNYTYSAYLTAPSDAEALIYVRLSRPGAPNGSWEDKSSNIIPAGKSGLAKVTFSIPTDTTTISFRVLRFASVQTSTKTIQWSREKLELGSNVTTWTSNQQDDKLLSVPQYVGIGSKDTMNPADFVWNLSPEYNQSITYNSIKEVELQLSPDNIYAKVAEAPDYIEWKELIDSKPNINDLNNVYDQLEGLSSADETILASMAELEMANNGVLTTITQAIEGMDGTLSTITDYMFFGKDGLTIGKSNSTLKVNISNTELAFYDNSTKVAWVDSQRLNIREALIEKKIKVGNHIIEKFDDKEEITIFKYDGI